MWYGLIAMFCAQRFRLTHKTFAFLLVETIFQADITIITGKCGWLSSATFISRYNQDTGQIGLWVGTHCQVKIFLFQLAMQAWIAHFLCYHFLFFLVTVPRCADLTFVWLQSAFDFAFQMVTKTTLILVYIDARAL